MPPIPLAAPQPVSLHQPVLQAPPPTTTIDFWRPNPGPQEVALMQPDTVFEILYGGARGGGKTDAGIVWIGEDYQNPRYRGLAIRKNAEDLSDWVDRAVRMYSPWGAKAAYRPAEIRFPSGALIKTGHLKDKSAYTKYVGQEYQKILIEELTLIPEELAYQQLIGSCRSTVPGLSPQIFATTNPGNIGHAWVKKRWGIGGKYHHGWPFLNPKTQRKAMYIPARVEDNPQLLQADPGYVNLLEGLKETDEQLWKAWRLGNWDVFIGQVYTEWMYEKHTYEQMDYPFELCTKFMCFDWGYSAPGVMLWCAVTPENRWGVRRVYVYRELWQNKKEPEEWAVQLQKINSVDPVSFMALPHDCYAQTKGSETIADVFRKVTGVPQKRMPTQVKNARINRAALLHRYLNTAADGRPYLLVHKSCANTTETIPELVYDENNLEDVDTRGPDHAYDALTGGLLTMYTSDGGSGSVTTLSNQRADLEHWHPTKGGAILAPDFKTAFEQMANRPK